MDFFDIIRELRTGSPVPEKAAKAMKILGWICVGGAVWNYAFYYIGPFREAPFNLPSSFPYTALGSFLLVGSLFLYSSRAINKNDPMGKTAGQIAIILLFALFVGLMFFVFPLEEFAFEQEEFPIIFGFFLVIFFAQFGVPAYYGVRYLGRLSTESFHPGITKKARDRKQSKSKSLRTEDYKDALLPFGVIGTFAVLLATFFLSFLIIEKMGGLQQLSRMFFPTFLIIFLAPVLYNFIPSPFQKKRNTIASFTGGGSIYLFNGTWPFFRLIVYKDGLEIRVMFHRFFIPYDQMEDIPDKIGFFSRGILIKSDLPGVPSGIRFQGFGMKKVIELINTHRNRFNQNG